MIYKIAVVAILVLILIVLYLGLAKIAMRLHWTNVLLETHYNELNIYRNEANHRRSSLSTNMDSNPSGKVEEKRRVS